MVNGTSNVAMEKHRKVIGKYCFDGKSGNIPNLNGDVQGKISK